MTAWLPLVVIISLCSILFASAAGETRAFPSAAKALTVPNLLSFVVANLGEEVRIVIVNIYILWSVGCMQFNMNN